MPPREVERRSLELTPQEWAHLEALAERFDTCPPSGVTAGQPSWRSLVKELARGQLTLVRVETPPTG
jgi:hypothetical protein